MKLAVSFVTPKLIISTSDVYANAKINTAYATIPKKEIQDSCLHHGKSQYIYNGKVHSL